MYKNCTKNSSNSNIYLLYYNKETKNAAKKALNNVTFILGDKTETANNWDMLPPLGLRAPCASAEDLTCHDDISDDDEDDDNVDNQGCNKNQLIDEDATPTPSGSLCSSPSIHCGSLAVTPVHHPKTDIDLCFKENENRVQAT